MIFLKRKKRKASSDSTGAGFLISDGSGRNTAYDADDYCEFLSNGRTNNEKVEAEEYYDRFLNKKS